jgi:hypothetical protein
VQLVHSSVCAAVLRDQQHALSRAAAVGQRSHVASAASMYNQHRLHAVPIVMNMLHTHAFQHHFCTCMYSEVTPEGCERAALLSAMLVRHQAVYQADKRPR